MSSLTYHYFYLKVMNFLITVILKSFKNLLSLQIVIISLLPMIIAVILWGGVTILFWDSLASLVSKIIGSISSDFIKSDYLVNMAGTITLSLILGLLLIPLIFLSGSMITSIFIMPFLLTHVASEEYSQLERRGNRGFLRGFLNTLIHVLIFCIIWISTLPLWLLLGPAVPFVGWILTAWINQRIYTFDGLSAHATNIESEQVIKNCPLSFFGLGLITTSFYFIPILNVLAPTFMGLAFSHFCLHRLSLLRRDKLEY